MAQTIETTSPLVMPGPLEDLSGPELLRKRLIGRVSTETLRYLSDAFTSRGFDWLLPVIFSKSTDPLWPDPGASIEKRIETEIYGEKVRTTQSMIIHKLVACSIAYPRLFVFSPNVRIEKRERKTTGWHTYEFTQLDFEIRGASFKDIRNLVEDVIIELMGHLKKKTTTELASLRSSDNLETPGRPFEVLDRENLVSKYGGEWESRLSADIQGPVWVTNIPREFYDFEDPASGRWDNYDLFVPKYGEILSGARREWEFDKISKKMERDGVKKENYGLLLKLASGGKLKPSAGAGIGVERLVGWMVGSKHIGEVQPFPKLPGLVYEL